MKIDNIDNIANKEKSPDKAERSASIDELKKTQKFFDFNDLSSNAATINKNLIIPEKDALFDYLPPGSSKLKKLLLNSDPEVANLNINNEKVHNNSEYLNNSNINNNSVSAYVLPLESTPNNNININASTKINNNNNSILKPSKSETSKTVVSSNGEKKSTTKKSNVKKVFWCDECNQPFIKSNLFNHMKSAHNKFTCLYCYGFFPKIDVLEKHLVKKHKVQNTSFSDEESLRNYFDVKHTDTKIIKAVCCNCGSIFMITDNNFKSHSCGADGEKETFLTIKEGVQNVCKIPGEDLFPNLAVNSNNEELDHATSRNMQSNAANASGGDDFYCEKAIQQWLQPNNSKSTLNGAASNSNEASSQSVPAEYPNSSSDNNSLNNITRTENWHVEEEKLPDENADKLIVPKLTLKIPKAFQNQTFDTIDSDEDSGDEEEDESAEDSENCELDKSNANNEKNMSNSINEYSSSLSDSDNEDSSKAEIVDSNKRPDNMPCLKLKIKNLTSNPESVLENFDYAATKEQIDKSTDENEISNNDSSNNNNNNEKIEDQPPQNDVDMSECPMDIEPTISSSPQQQQQQQEIEPKKIIIDGILITPANEDILPIDIRLDESLDRIDILKLMKICLRASFPYCLYCNHARKIVVNGKGIGQHFITHHRFHAFVDSITAEELHPEKFVTKFESSIDELSTCYFNLDTYDDHDEEKKEGHVTIAHDKLYECFQCRFQTPIHKELYLHNRKMHQKSLINCLMCKVGFYSYSELLCHICPGIANKQTFNDYKFYCCLCNMDNIPSAFRLMVHLRKRHYACDVCLEKCSDQSKLSSHVWKHKLLHICYRCHIFYQNKADIMKHLFWKHGTEGIECKKCLQKKWPHVYHFCIPPSNFTCTHCEMTFSRAISLKVHLRLHDDEGAKYPCTTIGCEKKFISKKLLIRHLERHQSELAALENQDRTESTVIIPQEIPNGCCTRTIPVVFKRFIKKPAVRKIEMELKEPQKIVEPEPKKEEEQKEPKSLPDLPETKLNLSESSEDESSSDESKTTVPEQQKHLNDDRVTKNSEEVTKGSIDDKKLDSLVQLKNKISTLSDSDDDEEPGSSNNNTKNSGSEKNEIKQEKVEIKDEKMEVKHEPSSIEPMKNILENLKNFQESQGGNGMVQSDSNLNLQSVNSTTQPSTTLSTPPNLKSESTVTENLKKVEPDPIDIPDKMPEKVILHVCMSDHDYAKLYRPGAGTTTDDLEDVIKSATIDKDKNSKKSDEKSPTKGSKKKSSNVNKKSDDFSSSDSSSDSSSGSSNSSSSGSSSSDSSTSDSSSSEASSTNTNANRQRTKKYTKKRSKKENKKETEEVEVSRDPDDIIYESDLLTDETDTDEDFYDEHPLKKTDNQALAEKRKQLGDLDGIIENSRPSTPSLPPDEMVEKRTKVKRRKREYKKSISSPTKRQREHQSTFVNADDESTSFSVNYQQRAPETPQNFKNSKFNQGLMHTSTPLAAPRIELHQANQIRQLLQSTQQQPVLPILKEQHHYHHQHQANNNNNEYISVSRVSSAQSSRMNSDNESGIKRSQRRRIPNKFYGYTSDDETSQLSINDPFKPIPPPNLTWNKEDLPSKQQQQQQQQQLAQTQQQRVAPLKLNLHNEQFQQQPPHIYENFEASQQQLPINNLYNSTNSNSNNNNNTIDSSAYNYSDSESSNDQLHISEQQPRKRKRKLPSQDMYAFHTLETPPTVQQPPIPRLKLTIGSNNKIRRRNINPLKPPAKKRRKMPASTSVKPIKNNSSMRHVTSMSNASTLTNSKHLNQNMSDMDETFNVNSQLSQEKKQKLEEAIMNTQQYFQRYNHTQVANAEPQEQMENDERVYCYCRRAYDDLQGMIGCDGPNCQIEWFHFECVGILVPPKGNWFCPECQKQQQAF